MPLLSKTRGAWNRRRPQVPLAFQMPLSAQAPLLFEIGAPGNNIITIRGYLSLAQAPLDLGLSRARAQGQVADGGHLRGFIGRTWYRPGERWPQRQWPA